MSNYAITSPLAAELGAWFEFTDWIVDSSSANSILLENDDGSFTRINGQNFVLDPTTNEPTSGTVTSIEHLYFDGLTVVETITGFSVPLTQLRAVYDDVFGLQDIPDGYYNPSLT